MKLTLQTDCLQVNWSPKGSVDVLYPTLSHITPLTQVCLPSKCNVDVSLTRCNNILVCLLADFRGSKKDFFRSALYH